MTFRRWIAFATIIGILLNAGFVVRHSMSVVDGTLEHQDLRAALGVICQANGGASPLGDAELPGLPAHPAKTDCPVCLGLVTAAIVPSASDLALPVDRCVVALTMVAQRIADRIGGVRPPPRGPPTVV